MVTRPAGNSELLEFFDQAVNAHSLRYIWKSRCSSAEGATTWRRDSRFCRLGTHTFPSVNSTWLTNPSSSEHWCGWPLPENKPQSRILQHAGLLAGRQVQIAFRGRRESPQSTAGRMDRSIPIRVRHTSQACRTCSALRSAGCALRCRRSAPNRPRARRANPESAETRIAQECSGGSAALVTAGPLRTTRTFNGAFSGWRARAALCRICCRKPSLPP